MNAITLLKQDHGNVEALFKRFEALTGDTQDADPVEKREIADKVITQLSVHGEIEEQVIYPAMRAKVGLGTQADRDVLEALEEHHMMKLALNELEKLPATNERFDAKFTVLMENVRHHVEEEEGEGGLFEQCRKLFKANELNEMGQRMEDLKATVPTRPHPFSPDQPPFNALLGLPVAVFDRVITAGKELVTNALQQARKNKAA